MKPRRHPDFSSPEPSAKHECNKYCKVHYYWDFEADMHLPLPTSYNFLTSGFGWVTAPVFTGPPGYNPRKPTYDQSVNMLMHCPAHIQIDLTCDFCMRHTFRPYEV